MQFYRDSKNRVPVIVRRMQFYRDSKNEILQKLFNLERKIQDYEFVNVV